MHLPGQLCPYLDQISRQWIDMRLHVSGLFYAILFAVFFSPTKLLFSLLLL